ncbi:DUF2142 domain-containing protein [Leifsonia poae]|uniref:DUF2142 domain-containing protein n=1 Tax=Leifsonia poae TaxID=110933 RepID=UPI003D66D3A4
MTDLRAPEYDATAGDPGDSGPAARRPVRAGGSFRLIFLAPAIALIALLAWVLASPVGASPDDDFHLVSTWCALGDRPGLCEPGDTAGERTVPASLVSGAKCYVGKPTVSAECQERALASTATVSSDRGNFRNSYPPVYYAVMGAFASPNIVGSILVMRVLNVLIFIGMGTALYALLSPSRRRTLLWMWLISTVPLGLFIIASNNPSSWTITGLGGAWLALLGYFESGGRRRVLFALLFIVSVFLAAGSRGDGAIYIVIAIGAVLVLTARRARAYWISAILPAAMAVVGLAFYFTTTTGAIASTGLNDGNPDVVVHDAMTVFVRNLAQAPSLWAGAFGTWPLGWFDTEMPAIVTLGATGCAFALVFVNLASMNRRKLLVLIGVGFVLYALPVFVLQRSLNVVGTQVQPRYLLPLLILFLGVAMLQVGRREISLTRLQRVVIMATLAVAQAVALYYNIRRYTVGDTATGWRLSGEGSWWWSTAVTPTAVVLIGSVAYALLVFVLVREAALVRPRRDDGASGDRPREIANAL